MRLGAGSGDGYVAELGAKSAEISDMFVSRMAALCSMRGVRVMLGDSTVTEQQTFDPKAVQDYLGAASQKLEGWDIHDVSLANNEDVRRVFVKFSKRCGNYLLSGHLSVQFHVLLYYRPEQRVLDCQRELGELVDASGDAERQASEAGDQLILDRLREMGYKDLDHAKLFEIFYKDDKLVQDIYAEAAGPNAEEYSERKRALFAELDSMLIETYHVAPVLIDETRLVTGEEGLVCALDLEFLKGGSKEGLFDPKKMPPGVQKEVAGCLDVLHAALAA